MRILVTGGAGFIGYHLGLKLLEEGHTVVAVDDLSTGSMVNVDELGAQFPAFRFVRASVTNDLAMRRVFEEARPDRVYHLAAAVGVRRVHEDPLGTVQINVRGTEVILDEVLRQPVPFFVASSSEVYGRSPRARFSEEDDLVIGSPHVSRWSYAASKVLDEFLALAYARERGLPVVIGRFFNTVGPRQHPDSGMVLPMFVRQALRGEPLVILGDGRQTRCFAHAADVARDIAQLMETPEAHGDVYNVGSDDSVTIRELAERVRSITGSNSEIVLRPQDTVFHGRFEDIVHRAPDLGRLRSRIGELSRVPLDTIIADTAAWLRRVGV